MSTSSSPHCKLAFRHLLPISFSLDGKFQASLSRHLHEGCGKIVLEVWILPTCTCCTFRSIARRINSFQPLKCLQSMNTRSLLALQLVCMTCVVPSFKLVRPYSHRQMTCNGARCTPPPFFFNELLHVKIDFFLSQLSPSMSTG